MQGVILAAGKGTRMNDLTKDVPKPMLKIKNKPILAWKIEMLPREIDEVILIVGYLQEKIKEYFGDFYDGRKIIYLEQKELNGSGGAIFLARDILKGKFLVMMGDDLYLKSDVEKILKKELAILGFEVENPDQFGIIKLNEKGEVKDIIEKPKIKGPAPANIGLYVLNENFFDYPLVLIGGGEFGLPQTMMQMKDKYNISFEEAERWFPIGNPDDLEIAQKEIDLFV